MAGSGNRDAVMITLCGGHMGALEDLGQLQCTWAEVGTTSLPELKGQKVVTGSRHRGFVDIAETSLPAGQRSLVKPDVGDRVLGDVGFRVY